MLVTQAVGVGAWPALGYLWINVDAILGRIMCLTLRITSKLISMENVERTSAILLR